MLLKDNKNKDESCPKQHKLMLKSGKKVLRRAKLLHNVTVTFQVIYTSMKKVCLHDISIHTKFHQNRSINECSRTFLA